MLAHNLGIKRFSFQLETQRHNKAFAIFFTFVEKELSGSEPFFHFLFGKKTVENALVALSANIWSGFGRRASAPFSVQSRPGAASPTGRRLAPFFLFLATLDGGTKAAT